MMPRQRRAATASVSSPVTAAVLALLLTLHGASWLLVVERSSSPAAVMAWTSSPHALSSPRRIHQYRQQQQRPTLSSSLTDDASSAATTSTARNKPSTAKIPYNWKENWYALTIASYVPSKVSKSAETVPAAVYGHPLVLWREEDDGPIYCADDVCPHRAAALTEGRVRNGTLQCYYHGWMFAGREGGQCTAIPQLEPGGAIPKRACLKMRPCRVSEGLVWVWMGDDTTAEPSFDPPSTGVLDENGKADGWTVYDFMIDLPYNNDFLVENLLDPAHIAISHDRTDGGGRRENAQGYEMEINEDSMTARGFTGQFRLLSQDQYTNFTYEAPGIIRNKVARDFKGNPIRFEAALHCMPVGLGRSRLFFRVYNKGFPKILTFIRGLTPLWLQHLNSCKVLEQDVGLITTQEDHFARNPTHELSDDYLLIKSSDGYVGAYRRWLDRVGEGLPWWQGLVSSSSRSNADPLAHVAGATVLPPALSQASHRASNEGVVETRYHRHVVHCPVTRNALRNVVRCKRFFAGLAFSSLSIACAMLPRMVGTKSLAGPLMRMFRLSSWTLPLGIVGAVAMHYLEKQFYVSFKRKKQLQGESGLVP